MMNLTDFSTLGYEFDKIQDLVRDNDLSMTLDIDKNCIHIRIVDTQNPDYNVYDSGSYNFKLTLGVLAKIQECIYLYRAKVPVREYR